MKKLTKKEKEEADRVWKKLLSNKKFKKKLIDAMTISVLEVHLNWKHQIEKKKRKGGGK